jgi:hypothetical protein
LDGFSVFFKRVVLAESNEQGEEADLGRAEMVGSTHLEERKQPGKLGLPDSSEGPLGAHGEKLKVRPVSKTICFSPARFQGLCRRGLHLSRADHPEWGT